MANPDLLANIAATERDIRECRDRIKATNEQLTEAVSELPEYQTAQTAAEAAKARRSELRAAVEADSDLSAWQNEVAEEGEKLRDLREILSLHLMAYRQQSNTSYLESDESRKVRPIIVTAKLGKPEYHQEEMFERRPHDVSLH